MKRSESSWKLCWLVTLPRPRKVRVAGARLGWPAAGLADGGAPVLQALRARGSPRRRRARRRAGAGGAWRWVRSRSRSRLSLLDLRTVPLRHHGGRHGGAVPQPPRPGARTRSGTRAARNATDKDPAGAARARGRAVDGRPAPDRRDPGVVVAATRRGARLFIGSEVPEPLVPALRAAARTAPRTPGPDHEPPALASCRAVLDPVCAPLAVSAGPCFLITAPPAVPPGYVQRADGALGRRPRRGAAGPQPRQLGAGRVG